MSWDWTDSQRSRRLDTVSLEESMVIAVVGLDRFTDAQMTRHCKSREEHAGRCQEIVRALPGWSSGERERGRCHAGDQRGRVQ